MAPESLIWLLDRSSSRSRLKNVESARVIAAAELPARTAEPAEQAAPLAAVGFEQFAFAADERGGTGTERQPCQVALNLYELPPGRVHHAALIGKPVGVNAAGGVVGGVLQD